MRSRTLTLSVIIILLMVNHVLASLGRPVQQPVERADVISCVATTPLIQWNLSFRPFDTQAGVQYSKNSPIGGGRLIPTEKRYRCQK